MADHIPESLQAADIARFARRATQLENVKPIIAYWCNYWIVNEILSRGLHTADDASMGYTTSLMDRLEQDRTGLSGTDEITDEVAAQAYVKQFALETFHRADNAMTANKVSAQTADTFRAAATFLDLMGIWSMRDPEIMSKSIYAKKHAIRIHKALKAGEDPNLSNPKPQEAERDELEDNQGGSSHVDAQTLDPEVFKSDARSTADGIRALSPSMPDPPHATAVSDLDPSSHQSPSAPGLATQYQDNVSPMTSAASEGAQSVGGGYFPEIPSNMAGPSEDLRDLTPEEPGSTSSYTAPTAPQDLGTNRQAEVPAVSHHHTMTETELPPSSYRTDDEAITNAQKHAKWAVSALNFEDVETAVRELRIALQSLGAC